MKHNRLIIENRTYLTDVMILNKIMAVVNMGKISQYGGEDGYCAHTTFHDGTEVWCAKNKGSDRFVVAYSSNPQNK